MRLVNKTGYLKGAKTAKNPVNIIPSNLITTQGMAFPIKANGKTLYPNTGQYKFNTPYVVETSLKQEGANELVPDKMSKTKLSKAQEIAYQRWKKSKGYNESDDYDMRGFWKKHGFKNLGSPKGGEHFTDEFKRLAPFSEGDNYPTLSDESNVASKFDKRRQGTWTKDDKYINYQDGADELKASDAAKFTYRIKDKKRRDTQIRDMYNNTLDSFRGDTTGAKRHFKSFFTHYGSERFDGVRPLEGYYGFDRKDYDDKTLDSLGRNWHKQMKTSEKNKNMKPLLKYQGGTTSVSNRPDSRILEIEKKERLKKLEKQKRIDLDTRKQESNLGPIKLKKNNAELSKATAESIRKFASDPKNKYGLAEAKKEMRKTLPSSGRVDMTAGPLDVAAASAAGLPGATLRLAGGALNSALGATIPGTPLTVGQGLNAYGGYDAIANRAPQVVRDLKNKKYESAAGEAALGALGLYGLKQTGVMDPKKLEATGRLLKKAGKDVKYLGVRAGNDIKYKIEDEIAHAKRLGADLKNELDNTKKIIRFYKNQKNPQFLSKEEEKMLTSVRNIGGTVRDLESEWKPAELKDILINKARNLSEKQFASLTGKSKGEILDFIHSKDPAMHHEIMQSLKNAGAGADEVNWGSFKKQGSVANSRIKVPEINDYEREAGIIKNEIDPFSGMMVGPNLKPRSKSSFSPLNLAKNFNYRLGNFLNKRLNIPSEEPMPKYYEKLIGLLSNESGKKEVFKKVREAAGKVNAANEGDAFIPSGSLSTDSYPLSYNILKRFLEEGKGSVGYHGIGELNTMGQLSKIGLDREYSVKEINSLIKELRKHTGKNIPYAHTRGYDIVVPKLTFTRNAVKDAPRRVIQGSKPSSSAIQLPAGNSSIGPAPTINLTRSSPPAPQLSPPPQTIVIDDLDDPLPFKKGSKLVKYKNGSKSVSLAFSRGEKDPKGGLTQKGVDKYNRATGGNLKMAVTTPPSKLKPGSKAANRRKSFCARMSGVKGPMEKNGKPTRKALALRKWNC